MGPCVKWRPYVKWWSWFQTMGHHLSDVSLLLQLQREFAMMAHVERCGMQVSNHAAVQQQA